MEETLKELFTDYKYTIIVIITIILITLLVILIAKVWDNEINTRKILEKLEELEKDSEPYVIEENEES